MPIQRTPFFSLQSYHGFTVRYAKTSLATSPSLTATLLVVVVVLLVVVCTHSIRLTRMQVLVLLLLHSGKLTNTHSTRRTLNMRRMQVLAVSLSLPLLPQHPVSTHRLCRTASQQ